MYMWYVISRTIFANGTGKNAPWMWLKALTVFDNKFSWCSAALAYLYRQLEDDCRGTTKDGGVGGCMLLLSLRSWGRLPLGRPKSSKWNTWDDHDNPVRLPTWAYKWDLVSEVASEVNLLYKQYTNEMDSLTLEQVGDGMTLKAFQRSAYMLKPRKEFRWYSPDDYAKGKNPVAGGSRLSRMRSMDDEDDDDDESDDPE
ncbi:mutator protein [Hordeum vulgare]|nr:mutator protein [Hordeum vulgare]